MGMGRTDQRGRTLVEIWFAIAAVMLTAYVVLDGFDLGAGVVHLFVARSDGERRQVLGAIGPFWDGNEVWLLATGGALFVAFPPVLASGLSGFYFAIFLVLWSLILRGVAIEFRSHIEHPLWRTAWDFVFSAGSTLLPVLFGAALGNLVRGLPIDAEGYFSLSLFTDFTTTPPVGSSTGTRSSQAFSVCWHSQGTAPRSWCGGRMAPCRLAVAPRPPFSTVLLRSFGQWRRCRHGSSIRISS